MCGTLADKAGGVGAPTLPSPLAEEQLRMTAPPMVTQSRTAVSTSRHVPRGVRLPGAAAGAEARGKTP